ncbi:MAG: NUDIX hydrolase [Candidatus Delongbacteria bacterium]|nr:NUDIX hydrolase [Candidatus Delongbacteria bacterium]
MKIIKKEKVYSGKYSDMNITYFEDKFGNKKAWEFLERTNDTEAVVINAYHKDKVILVKQYKFPIKKYSIEFPAGLIDKGETPESTAVRELLEETGYKGKVTQISPPLCTSAGITSEIIYMVDMEITSEQGKQILDETEEIEVLEFDKVNLKQQLLDYIEEHPDCSIDARVWAAYFEG